jgi:hypothetical protein
VPLDYAWQLLGYLAKIALTKLSGPDQSRVRDFVDLIAATGIRVVQKSGRRK